MLSIEPQHFPFMFSVPNKREIFSSKENFVRNFSAFSYANSHVIDSDDLSLNIKNNIIPINNTIINIKGINIFKGNFDFFSGSTSRLKSSFKSSIFFNFFIFMVAKCL